jgi:hypothetical protein
MSLGFYSIAGRLCCKLYVAAMSQLEKRRKVEDESMGML